MQIIDRIARLTTPETRTIIDRVALTWEQRHRSRQRLVTTQGCEIALALPTGSRLQGGDLLAVPGGWIAVELALEDVLLVRPRSPQETAFVSYQIGNRHLPLEIGEHWLKTLFEPVLESYLGQQGIAVERAQLPFTPVNATSSHRHS
jgi:urease accessory protein